MSPHRLGYADRAYADSLADLGEIRPLPRSGGWLIAREIPGTDQRDVMGPYPIFDCRDWSQLAHDVDALRDEFVSLVLVTDPFSAAAPAAAQAAGATVLRPYKPHFVVDLDERCGPPGRPSRRRTAQRALARLDVQVMDGRDADATAWVRLYDHVVRRHSITGFGAFSDASLAAQLEVPGAQVLTAHADGELVAAQVCLRRGEVIYSHLAASSPEGYRRRAMHALDLFAVEHYAKSARWFDFGGGTGRRDDGLAAYKASWATHTRPTWLAGWVFCPTSYAAASKGVRHSTDDFFPRYRTP